MPLFCRHYTWNDWPNFLQDLTEFMRKPSNNSLSGLIVLESQETTDDQQNNKGVKFKIHDQFFENKYLFKLVFVFVLDLKDKTCIREVLKT